MADAQLFEDTITITGINDNKYDRVSRITANTESGDVFLTLDINTELFPVMKEERLHMILASTLNMDGSKEDEKGWREVSAGESSLADYYDYVCHGKIYRFEEGEGEDIKVFVSFGGLLLHMQGPYKKLTPMRIDYVYLLMKKV